MIIKKRKRKGIKISLFSDEQVLNISYGEILNSETLNFKNLKPKPDGLFCDKIFGSSSNKCYCEKTYSYDNLSFVCEYCETETSFHGENLKRNRFGYVKLNDYFLNPLYYKLYPRYLSLLINISLSNIKKVLYNSYYVVLFSSLIFLKVNSIISIDEYIFYKKKYYNKFYAESGINAFFTLLNNIDFYNEFLFIEKSIKDNSFNFCIKKNPLKRYKLLKNIFNLNINPAKIFFKNLIVLPPDLRPIIKLPNNTIVSSDLNELYKKVINCNLRLKKLKSFYGISKKIIFDEKKILQSNLDNLFLGNKENKNNYLKSLLNNLEGKSGIFRKNLLGKRVDYSGRAVIVSGSNLKFGECGIPLKLAMEIFRPFIYNKILSNKSLNIQMAKLEVDNFTKTALFTLMELLNEFYVLINRAPTLHRLGMQSFKPVLTYDNVIKLHPLVCQSFNADFDGDQMAIHLPITIKSRIECKTIFFSGNNILYPSDGSCCISPNKDIILGLYIYSKLIYKFKINFLIFNNLKEALIAYNFKIINLDSIIFIRFKLFNNLLKKIIYKIYKTNLCRILIFNIFPKNLFFSLLNKSFSKKNISKILNFLIYKYDFDYISFLSNNLMNIGFSNITKSGFSLCIEDMFFSFKKKNILINIKKNIINYNLDYLNFFITKINKKNKIMNLWECACDYISNLAMQNLSFSNYLDLNFLFIRCESFNYLYAMIDSGARGSDGQVKQICSNRGFMSYKKKNLLEIPSINSLREGLNVFEYFYFSHNSRKTLADTALKTSTAGYLTRKLVETSNNIFISEYDCKTKKGFTYSSFIDQGEFIENFLDRIFGKVLLKDFFYNNKILIKKNTMLCGEMIHILKNLNINSLKLRSSLKCESKLGICSLCYGLDLSKGKLVEIGSMVGILAAQSIGEPGTQLTMRTFHTGGAISKLFKKSFFKSNFFGKLKYSKNLKYVINKENLKIVVSKTSKIYIYGNDKSLLEYFNIPYSSYLLLNNNSTVNKNEIFCKWNNEYNYIISENSGVVEYSNIIEGLNCLKTKDLNSYEIIDKRLLPKIILYNLSKEKILSIFNLNTGWIINFKNNDIVEIGDILIKIPVSANIKEDIVGGLPKIDNFFEARIPKNSALLSPVSGVIYYKSFNNKKIIEIFKKDKLCFSCTVSEERDILFSRKDKINKGDVIINGDLNLHDILFIYGKTYLVNYLINNIKKIYFYQGVSINDKHLEIIIKQMLNKVIIVNPCKTKFLIGELVSYKDIIKVNKNLNFFEKAKFNHVLLGLTNISLNSDSFLSSASFQRTGHILSSAAINSCYDDMSTIKNISMLGKLFHAGTGSYKKLLNF